jgi:DedD protein
MADEEVHEIQLKGKQLVFLFMAATVVAVVIFLCGVMVGRGVPTRATFAIDTPEQASFGAGGSVEDLAPARAVSTDGNTPATAQETLTYATLLEEPEPLVEPLPESLVETLPEPPAVVPEPTAVVSESVVALPPALVTPEPAPAPPAPVAPQPVAAPATAVADATLAEPPGTGFVVQVAAVRQRDEADTIARQLSTKGYPAFVTISGPNFRVRVGKYADRSEAETIAGRLQAEERFEPWITR